MLSRRCWHRFKSSLGEQILVFSFTMRFSQIIQIGLTISLLQLTSATQTQSLAKRDLIGDLLTEIENDIKNAATCTACNVGIRLSQS